MMKNILVSIVFVFIAITFTISAMGENEYKLLRYKSIDYSNVKRTQYDIEVTANTGDEEIAAQQCSQEDR